jgi:hypothetical protein
MLMRALGLTVLILCASACGGGNRLKPTTVPSTDGVGYAVRYPDALATAADSFAAHKRQAQQLSRSLPEHTPKLQNGDDRTLLQRVVDYADVDGRREWVGRARQNERAIRAYWESERAAIGARTASAVQKQVKEAGCADLDPQPVVQHALRDGFERQLERRMRAESEAQRVLDQYRPQLTAATYASMQRLVDEIISASYLVYVALPEDVVELQRLQAEQNDVSATLQRGLNDERVIQASGVKGADLKASQDRVQRIEASRAGLAASNAKLENELRDYMGQLKQAQDSYERARLSVRDALGPQLTAAK